MKKTSEVKLSFLDRFLALWFKKKYYGAIES